MCVCLCVCRLCVCIAVNQEMKCSLFCFYYFILYVRVFCLLECLCTICVPGVHKGQKRGLDPLELDV